MTCVLLERDGAVARFILNRPAQLNAVSPELLEDLDRACAAVEADPTVAVVTLTAAGRAFCAGADLRVVQPLAPIPTAGKVHGALAPGLRSRGAAAGARDCGRARHGAGGRAELTLVCDLVVADEAARLGDQHANFGLVAGGGGSQRLPRLIGARRAKELMLLGGWLSAQRGAGLGPRQPRGAGGAGGDSGEEKLARELAAKSAAAARAVKMLVARGLPLSLPQGLDLEGEEVACHMRGADAAEGLRAFVEKRAPRFGRGGTEANGP